MQNQVKSTPVIESTYRTGDIALASYLIVLGHRIVATDKSNPHYAELVFSPVPSAEALACFDRDEAVVEVKRLCAAVRVVKAAIYGGAR